MNLLEPGRRPWTWTSPRLALARGLLLFLLIPEATLCATEPAESATAVVYALSGHARLARGGAGAERDVRLFDWIDAGAVVRVAPGSRLGLAFRNGERYELLSNARAAVLADRLRIDAGEVRPLPRVPAFPRLVPLVSAQETQPAAVRIRGGSDGAATDRSSRALADETVLRIPRTVEAARYEIEVEGESGVVFTAETASDVVRIPPGILRPGSRYGWRVRGPGRTGLPTEVRGELETLDEESASRRAALRDALRGEGTAASLALLSEVDRRLGLLPEARAELLEARALAPGDPALEERLARVAGRPVR